MKRIGPLMVAILTTAWLYSSPGKAAAPDSFQQARADYNGGKYATALSEFEDYKAIYPNNALARYYTALCHQALNHLDQAKVDYQFVAEHGDARLCSMSKRALSQLSGVQTQVTFAHASPSPVQTANQVAHSNVKRILEFSADW